MHRSGLVNPLDSDADYYWKIMATLETSILAVVERNELMVAGDSLSNLNDRCVCHGHDLNARQADVKHVLYETQTYLD